jgi:hypothetical protein
VRGVVLEHVLHACARGASISSWQILACSTLVKCHRFPEYGHMRLFPWWWHNFACCTLRQPLEAHFDRLAASTTDRPCRI